MVQQLRACTAPAGVEFSFQHQSGYNISVPRDPTPSSSLPDTDTTRHTSPDRHTDIYTILKNESLKTKKQTLLLGMVAHTCTQNTWESKAELLGI